eukprot:8130171-Pyramimonas_sp.AAC.1
MAPTHLTLWAVPPLPPKKDGPVLPGHARALKQTGPAGPPLGHARGVGHPSLRFRGNNLDPLGLNLDAIP